MMVSLARFVEFNRLVAVNEKYVDPLAADSTDYVRRRSLPIGLRAFKFRQTTWPNCWTKHFVTWRRDVTVW